MNQFITLDKNIPRSPKKQDFGYFDLSMMPKTVQEREAEYLASKQKLDEEKQAFEKMKAEAEQQTPPPIKRRRKRRDDNESL